MTALLAIYGLYGGETMNDIQAALDDGLITAREAQALADRIPMPEKPVPELTTRQTNSYEDDCQRRKVAALLRTMTKDAWGVSDMAARNQFISVFNHSPRAVVALANGYRAIA